MNWLKTLWAHPLVGPKRIALQVSPVGIGVLYGVHQVISWNGGNAWVAGRGDAFAYAVLLGVVIMLGALMVSKLFGLIYSHGGNGKLVAQRVYLVIMAVFTLQTILTFFPE